MTKKITNSIKDAGLFGVGQTGEVFDDLFRFFEDSTPERYDRIMDAAYNNRNIGGGFHRTYDGSHTLFGSYKKIKTQTGEVNISEFIDAHINELVTPEGIPFFTLDRDAHFSLAAETSEALGGVVSAGQLKSYTRDLNSITAPELLGATIGSVFLLAAIKSGDSKAISRVIAANICVGLATANPLQLSAGLMGLGYAVVNKKIESWELLKGAAPIIGGALGFQIAENVLQLGAKTSLAVSIASGIGTSVLLQKVEAKKRGKILSELGDNSQYVAVLTPGVLRRELEIVDRKQNTLGLAI